MNKIERENGQSKERTVKIISTKFNAKLEKGSLIPGPSGVAFAGRLSEPADAAAGPWVGKDPPATPAAKLLLPIWLI